MMDFLSGKKTYVAAAGYAVLMGLMPAFADPITEQLRFPPDFGEIEWRVIFEAALAVFIRQGVAKVGE